MSEEDQHFEKITEAEITKELQRAQLGEEEQGAATVGVVEDSEPPQTEEEIIGEILPTAESPVPPSSESEQDESADEGQHSAKDKSEQNTDQPPASVDKGKKKVRFNLTETKTTAAKVESHDALVPTTSKLEVKSKSSFRKLKDINIDLSKLTPAKDRYEDTKPVPSLSEPTFSQSIYPRIPGSGPTHGNVLYSTSTHDLSLSGLSYEELTLPGPSRMGPSLEDISQREIGSTRRQFHQIDPFEADTLSQGSSEGSYLKATESRCLFERVGKYDNEDEPFEWDFDETDTKNVPISESQIVLPARPSRGTYKLKVDDEDPYTNIALKNGDKIEIVAEVHPVLQETRSTPETVREEIPLEPIAPMACVPQDEQGENTFLPCDESPRMVRDVEFEEAEFQDWVEPPSPTYPTRRHTI